MPGTGTLLASVGDVARAIRDEPRLAYYKLHAEGDGYLEVELGKCVLVLAWPVVWADRERLAPHLKRARAGTFPLLLCGAAEELETHRADEIKDPPTLGVLTLPMSVAQLAITLRAQAELALRRRQAARREVLLERARYEVDLLISVGRSLSQQRDLDSLLGEILLRAREVTGADAGSVYTVEGEDEDVARRKLRFKVSQNDSVNVPTNGFTMDISGASIVGTCVLSGEALAIDDLYALDEPGTGNNPWGFKHDRSFDEKIGYQTRSILTVPMISAREEVIGVIQLINKRARGVLKLSNPSDFDDGVVPFDDAAEELARALASQAGIALENALLYDEVRQLFEGFVHASVTAIESRDPTTSGHSNRVADLTVALAKAADRIDTGRYRDLTFSFNDLKQIEYAALLHDFGKVGVREHVLVKAKKLYEHERALVLARFDYIRKALEHEHLASKVRYLAEASRDEVAERLSAVEGDVRARLAEIDEFVEFVLKANEPTVLEQGGFERIAEIATRSYVDYRGEARPYLSAEEAVALQIPRGSLTVAEREQIESHVVHTYNFLRQIPWGRTYRDIPEIAGAHHEKLDGTGYPHRLAGDNIPPQARMMSISDIYDALTASDRPYKRAVPESKALDILGYEVKAGKLDDELYRLFIDAKVFEIVRPR